jgi:hypothetical protein
VAIPQFDHIPAANPVVAATVPDVAGDHVQRTLADRWRGAHARPGVTVCALPLTTRGLVTLEMCNLREESDSSTQAASIFEDGATKAIAAAAPVRTRDVSERAAVGVGGPRCPSLSDGSGGSAASITVIDGDLLSTLTVLPA